MTNFNELDLNTTIGVNVTTSMTMKEMVALHNALAEQHGVKPVKRFADREAAMRRTRDLIDMNNQWVALRDAEQEKAAPQRLATDRRTLSEAIAASWTVAETAAKRTTRHHVEVDGMFFRSVKQAFEHFDLPLKEHIKFRMQLKAAGKLAAYDMNWEVVDAE